ncbi:MAG TPA: hypothetical protein VHD63_25575 [Ktedonobacteraceae bacterium]|nr:hypothetical protein [Ktedonobacteraceae bacterium]
MRSLLAVLYAHAPALPIATRAGWTGILALADIATFFSNLYHQLTLIALAASIFFFARAALLYMTSGAGNERNKTHALGALYAALGGLALALLAKTIGGIVSTAAHGQ